MVYPYIHTGATQTIQFSMIDAEEDDAEGEVVRDEETNTESTGELTPLIPYLNPHIIYPLPTTPLPNSLN